MATERALLLALLAACSAPVDEPESPRASFWTAESALAAPLENAAARIAAATGRADVVLDPQGLPVVYGDGMVNPTRGDFDCAQTEMVLRRGVKTATGISVDVTPEPLCMPTEAQLIHEAIHALAPEARHTDSGIFSDRGSPDGVLDVESLERLCESFECSLLVHEPRD